MAWPGLHPFWPNPVPTYPLGHKQTGPLAMSTQAARGWQKFCLEHDPLGPLSEGVVRAQYLPSPCHPAGQAPQ